MEPRAHRPILKRTGYVLLTIGIVDMAVLIYCIVKNISYWSSFNVIAIAGGIFLSRGSLGLLQQFVGRQSSCLLPSSLFWPLGPSSSHWASRSPRFASILAHSLQPWC